MGHLLTFISTFLTLIVLDGLWITLFMKHWFQKEVGHLLSAHVQWVPVGVFYVLYSVGLLVFIILPAVQNEWSLLRTLALGSLFGLIAYGTYDLTNAALLKNWSLSITILDMVWGASMSGITTVFIVFIRRKFGLM